MAFTIRLVSQILGHTSIAEIRDCRPKILRLDVRLGVILQRLPAVLAH